MRFAALMLVVYAGVILFGLNEFRRTPIGFIPQVDDDVERNSDDDKEYLQPGIPVMPSVPNQTQLPASITLVKSS